MAKGKQPEVHRANFKAKVALADLRGVMTSNAKRHTQETLDRVARHAPD